MPARTRAVLATALALVLSACFAASASAAGWSEPKLVGSMTGGMTSAAPEVSINANGDAIAVWRRLLLGPPSSLIVQAAYRPAGGDWGVVDTIATGVESSDDHQVAIGPAGNAIVLFRRQDGDGTSRIERRERLANGTWTAAEAISDDGGTGSDPAVAIGPDGTTTVAWARHNGVRYQVQSMTRPAGGAWGTVVDLSVGDDANSLAPQLAGGPGGTMYAAWERTTLSTGEIYAAFRAANGTWTPMQLVSDDTFSSHSAAIAADASGRATLIFGTRQEPQGPDHRVQATSSTGGNVWAPVGDVSGLSLGGNSMAMGNDPQLAVDDAGTATALWQQRVGSSIQLQSAFRPFGGGWAGTVTFPGANPLDGTYSASLAVTGAGNVTAAWGQRVGATIRIESADRDYCGRWAPTDVHTGAGTNGDPDVASSPTGDGVLVWTTREGTNTYQLWAKTRIGYPIPSIGCPPGPDPPPGPGPDPAPSPGPSNPAPTLPKAGAAAVGKPTQNADGSVSLAVTVNQAGSLKASATSTAAQLAAAKPRKRPKPVVVATTTKRAAKAGKVTLKLVPTGRKAKKRLKDTGKLSAKLTIVFTPTAGGRTATTTKAVVFKKRKDKR